VRKTQRGGNALSKERVYFIKKNDHRDERKTCRRVERGGTDTLGHFTDLESLGGELFKEKVVGIAKRE